jgi:excinuclease ABC subunit B
MKGFFPTTRSNTSSYYDYYQPEAYVPRTDTYIEKDAAINEQIDRMRHAATRALLERNDVIIVASVSCIYGIGAVETYARDGAPLTVGEAIDRADLLKRLVELQYRRNDQFSSAAPFASAATSVEIFPSHLEDRPGGCRCSATRSRRFGRSTR